MNRLRWIVGFLCVAAAVATGNAGMAQLNTSAASTFVNSSQAVPEVIRYSGVLSGYVQERVPVRFSIYAAATGGSALWSESQNITADKDGKYAVLLGSLSSIGLPSSIFADGQARWLGIQAAENEEERTLLASVPFSMKAADAATLAGKGVNEFVTTEQLQAQLRAQVAAEVAAQALTSEALRAQPLTTTPAPTGSGTTGYMPLWTAATTLGNSAIYQTGSGTAAHTGFATTAPASTVDINGLATVRGGLVMQSGNATASAALNSPYIDLVASSYSSSSAAAVPQRFRWQVIASGNDTGSPSASLALGYGTTGASGTGLSISPKGIITFAAGQTFPGGTVLGTTIKAGSGLTSSVSGTTQTLSVNPVAISILAGNSGYNNSALGASALASNKGSENAAIGGEALYANTTGSYNSATGDNTLSVNTTGSLNTANGFSALSHNQSGSSNTAVGSYAGPDINSSALTNSTAIGSNATVSQSNSLVLGQTTAGSPGASHVSVGIGTATPTTAMEISVNAPNVLGPTLLLSNPGGTNSSASFGQAAAASIDFKTYLHASTQNSPTSRIEAVDDDYGNQLVFQTKGAGSDSNALSTVMELIGGYGGSTYIGNPLIVDFYEGVPVNGPQVAGFGGDVSVDGTVSSDQAEFKIDHPSDPANKYLQHAAVSSSERMNIYSGNITTDELGLATVQLPDWFEIENDDFRYQLTTIGRDAHAWIAQKVAGHQFKIATNATFVEVSWQITAVRQDAYAKAHPLLVEKAKSPTERGFYRHPELYGQPASKRAPLGRHSELMTGTKARNATLPATALGNEKKAREKP